MTGLSMDSMYQEIILDHYKHPHHRGLPDDFDAEVHHVNPTCGDEVTMRVRVRDGQIDDLGWVGEGCSISQASTSVMSQLVVGRPVAEAMTLQETFLALMQAKGAPIDDAHADALEDAVAFEGVAVDHDPVLEVVAGDAVTVVLAVGVLLGAEVGDDHRHPGQDLLEFLRQCVDRVGDQRLEFVRLGLIHCPHVRTVKPATYGELGI